MENEKGEDEKRLGQEEKEGEDGGLRIYIGCTCFCLGLSQYGLYAYACSASLRAWKTRRGGRRDKSQGK